MSGHRTNQTVEGGGKVIIIIFIYVWINSLHFLSYFILVEFTYSAMWLRLSSNFKGDSLQNHSYWTIPRADHGDRFVGCEMSSWHCSFLVHVTPGGRKKMCTPFYRGRDFICGWVLGYMYSDARRDLCLLLFPWVWRRRRDTLTLL